MERMLRRVFLLTVAIVLLSAMVVSAGGGREAAVEEEGIQMIWMPKLLGIDYFNTCRDGAEVAARELGINLREDAPVEADVTQQIELIDNYITRRADIIAVAANDPTAIAPIMRRAAQAGITTVTWDADADVRMLFINQTSFELFGRGLIEVIAKYHGDDAQIGIITSFFTAPNQQKWIEWIEIEIAENHPNMEIVDIREGEEDQTISFRVAQDMIRAYPEMDAMIGLASTVLPGVAEAVKQAGKEDEIFVTGGSTPNLMRRYIKDGSSDPFLLWNTNDLGYLTVYAAHALHTGEISGTEGETFAAGRMGEYTIGPNSEVVMGPPFEFNAENIDDFDF